MKVCPTCERKYPDLISVCPSDQSDLMVADENGKMPASATAAKAAPAKENPAKEKEDTRSLEEKLFAPLPNRSSAAAAPAPAKAAGPPSVKMVASAPAPTAAPAKATAPPPPAPKPPAPNSTGKMSETVFDDTPQKSTKIAAIPAAADIPWNKVGMGAGAVVLVLVIGFFLFHKSSAPPPSNELTASPNAADVDMEMNLRDALGKLPALRNQNIDLRVSDGKVILTGEASSQAKIDQAIKAAKAMPGVTEVVNHIQVNPDVGVHSVGHTQGTTTAGLGNSDISNESGLATQAKAHDLTKAGDRAMSQGNYKAAASFYKQAVALNPNDTAASLGYTQAMEKLQQ